jgi:hypothetical protein
MNHGFSPSLLTCDMNFAGMQVCLTLALASGSYSPLAFVGVQVAPFLPRASGLKFFSCICSLAGVPNSGKSEWIDALITNLSEMYGWSFALCSLEKMPSKHAIQFIEKVNRKPFYDRYVTDMRPGREGERVKVSGIEL